MNPVEFTPIDIDIEPFIDTYNGGGARAILSEIESMLENLLANNEGGVIDLKTIPITHTEYQQLQYTLGQGEIKVMLDTLGSSIVRETSIAGVWWTTHYNEEDSVIAEIIEVTLIPAILMSDQEEVKCSLVELQNRIEQDPPLIV